MIELQYGFLILLLIVVIAIGGPMVFRLRELCEELVDQMAEVRRILEPIRQSKFKDDLITDLTEKNDRLTRDIISMRRAGFDPVPQDDDNEVWVIDTEAELAAERERSRTRNAE